MGIFLGNYEIESNRKRKWKVDTELDGRLEKKENGRRMRIRKFE